MAICAHCHTMDKSFFAPVCHACNNYTPFLHQVWYSTLFTTVVLGGFFGFFWVAIKIIG